jgi:hypothetical protein
LLLATYRIPLIDIDITDLLPIHFFIDPGPTFSWPIDEELSDERIHLYTHYGESRVETLERYLSLSQEVCSLNNLNQQSPKTNNNQDDATLTTENSSTTNTDFSNETNSTLTPTMNKKSARPSLNSFSKMIRRTFFDPFSSVKRASLKQQRQHLNPDTPDSSIISENEYIRRASSPLLNRRTNMLTIIVTNFQPKRPKTSDNMIKNYIDACMNKYQVEKNQKQINENENIQPIGTLTSQNGNHRSDWDNDLSSYQQPILYQRSHLATTLNRYQQDAPSSSKLNEKQIETSGRKLPQVPSNSSSKINALTRHVQKNSDIDDNDDLLPIENGQFSSNINYVQQTQRKPTQLTQVIIVCFV